MYYTSITSAGAVYGANILAASLMIRRPTASYLPEGYTPPATQVKAQTYCSFSIIPSGCRVECSRGQPAEDSPGMSKLMSAPQKQPPSVLVSVEYGHSPSYWRDGSDGCSQAYDSGYLRFISIHPCVSRTCSLTPCRPW